MADRREQTLAQLRPYIERARGYSGWSFGEVRVRRPDPETPWDYDAIVADKARGAERAIDLGTGGGERISALRSALPRNIVATEEWHVNAPVAYRRLAPLGVLVVWCSSLDLPFRDATFDLVLSRHEAIEPAELARVLRPGGSFVTQQVGHDDWRELHEFFDNITDFGDHYRRYQDGLAAAGMRIERAERTEHISVYETLGDFVYMLLTAPFMLPDFDPERDIDRLLALEDACRVDGGIGVTEVREIIVAAKENRG